MREIKFRVYCPKDKKIYKVLAISFEGEPTITVHYKPIIKKALKDVYLMQCMGEEDKKSKELYEHDVVEWVDDNKRSGIGIIKYARGEYFITQIDGYDNLFYDVYGATFEWKDLTKIGDIHSNPELLDKKE